MSGHLRQAKPMKLVSTYAWLTDCHPAFILAWLLILIHPARRSDCSSKRIFCLPNCPGFQFFQVLYQPETSILVSIIAFWDLRWRDYAIVY